jgi:hypothetical protein
MPNEPEGQVKQECVACHRGTDATPLLQLEYQDAPFWICPQHLPILIHDPARLIGILPGAENLRPADHHD